MKFLTRKLITHEDLNPRGYLHGGQLLKWIDEEGGIHAGIEMNTSLIVTKMMSEIDFKFPVILGDVIEIGMQTLDIGKTSCTLSCEVRSLHADKVVLTIDKIVYVRVNKYGLPKGHGWMSKDNWDSKKEIGGEVVKGSYDIRLGVEMYSNLIKVDMV